MNDYTRGALAALSYALLVIESKTGKAKLEEARNKILAVVGEDFPKRL